MRLRVLWFCAVLGGCAGEAVRPVAPSLATATDKAVESLDSWQIEGRVAIQKGDEGWNAALRWKKAPQVFQLRLVAPLGRGTYQLSGDEAVVELLLPDGRSYAAADGEQLMSTHLGWSIPVGGAQYWLRGIAAPGSQARSVLRDAQGLVTDFEQDGWRISVLRRQRVDKFDLPAKLFLHFKDLKVRIVIASWKLGAATGLSLARDVP